MLSGVRRAAIILAAGASQRMGTPKALLPWGNSSLLDHVIGEARAAGLDMDEIVVVLGPALRQLQLGVRTVYNPDPETGRSASIRLGSAVVADDSEAILVQSVDQPVPSSVISALFAALGAGVDLTVPGYQGRRGHPVCVSGRLLGELRSVTEEDQGLRAVVRRHATALAEVPVDTESVVWNLNDAAAYDAVKP